ncbi:hypothetical protein AMELA_G00145050 [Ameiurus melas]|uniref:Uncharacterized protein n=1 Tax=Ameiurus melas TaxID=219545 RepID=A0A7J6AGS9_AMEME|nr:hypothetical protein AMELA_G00145050 [Ameiurus melas]
MLLFKGKSKDAIAAIKIAQILPSVIKTISQPDNLLTRTHAEMLRFYWIQTGLGISLSLLYSSLNPGIKTLKRFFPLDMDRNLS